MRLRLYFISLWSIIDPIYYYLTRLRYLDSPAGSPPIFRVRLTKYKGRNVVLSDGTQIQRNDILVKIHLHNVRLLKELSGINNDVKKSLLIYQQVKESMPYLTRYIERHQRNSEIKGIIGITFINKGIKRLGFEQVDIINPFYKWYKLITLYPIHFLSSSQSFLKGNKKPCPSYLFMSKDGLFNKYGNPN
ncbi:MAG TPA: hypothetical protein VNM69_04735 [Bacillus sp. (in: firmicutes)]|uniref:YkoP family protein n=1 Tax=Bacillus litorisediminis TaxID=2922713 RepID=UPI0028BDA6B8|nr:hypothetical protein [Bacillus litorisediminis]HWO75211.1 hypothetical protein [Bacillus sp. (in: firmicutes)]